MSQLKMTRLALAVILSLSSVFAINTAVAQTSVHESTVKVAVVATVGTSKINNRAYSESGLTLPDASITIVYKYVDDRGRVHYTDTPPKQYQASAKVIDTKAKEGIASVPSLQPVANMTSDAESEWKAKDREFKVRQETRQKLEDELAAVRAELRLKEANVKTEPTEEDYEKIGRTARRLSPDFAARQEALKNEIEELKNKEREIKNEIAYPKTKNNTAK